jgi:hypothetical protein
MRSFLNSNPALKRQNRKKKENLGRNNKLKEKSLSKKLS